MLVANLLADRVYGVWFESHGVISWLILGLIAGWLAGKIARGRGFGCIADIVLGLVGSFIGGWVFTKLGIFGGGFWYSLAAATLGAVILVCIAHLFAGDSHH
ncbi:MAG TPA: GlsB/YeaQ/YmgE family stress response membrane protein [Candidatus Acidoferrum sp.]|nr:GlsB/YeaQ/YmgE family stress response membrane protein [Candidatus Acidoferrum sp.]